MHHFVLVVKILGETAGRHVFDFPLENLRDWVAHLLEDVEEEHEFVLALLAVRHVFVQLVYGCLQLFVLLKYFPAFIALLFKLAAVAVEEKVKLRLVRMGCHLLLEHQPGSLLMLLDLMLQVFNLEVPLINLLCHLLNVDPRLVFIPLQVQDVFLGRPQFLFLLL